MLKSVLILQPATSVRYPMCNDSQSVLLWLSRLQPMTRNNTTRYQCGRLGYLSLGNTTIHDVCHARMTTFTTTAPPAHRLHAPLTSAFPFTLAHHIRT